MGTEYLIDTNTIIDYLENKLPENALSIIDGSVVNLSVISRIELLVWPKATQQQLDILNNFIQTSRVFLLSEEIILRTIAIRREFRLKLPDAIIAATALVNNLSLLTHNTKDFEKINELIITDPYLL
ncbi:MAG: type II toxin-antitoxin system VapC family toxin [Mucilaginibacter sp.]